MQKKFAPIYGLDESTFTRTFDVYFGDDEEFNLGNIACRAIHLPGHTPDHLGYVMGKAIFTGDSIFNVSLSMIFQATQQLNIIFSAGRRVCAS